MYILYSELRYSCFTLKYSVFDWKQEKCLLQKHYRILVPTTLMYVIHDRWILSETTFILFLHMVTTYQALYRGGNKSFVLLAITELILYKQFGNQAFEPINSPYPISFILRGSVTPFPVGFCYRQVAILLRLLGHHYRHFPTTHIQSLVGQKSQKTNLPLYVTRPTNYWFLRIWS
jgi:hypothetical protein